MAEKDSTFCLLSKGVKLKFCWIEKNQNTGGDCALIQIGKDFFYCDLSYINSFCYEFMAFYADADGKVTDWEEVAMYRGFDHGVEALKSYIKRFAECYIEVWRWNQYDDKRRPYRLCRWQCE